jgi:hypothetical protein
MTKISRRSTAAGRDSHVERPPGTQRVQFGGEVFDAAAAIFLRDGEATLTAMSEGRAVEAELELVSFKTPTGRDDFNMAVAAGMDLLAIILPDGSTKYRLRDPRHLRVAESLGVSVERELLRQMRPNGLVQ